MTLPVPSASDDLDNTGAALEALRQSMLTLYATAMNPIYIAQFMSTNANGDMAFTDSRLPVISGGIVQANPTDANVIALQVIPGNPVNQLWVRAYHAKSLNATFWQYGDNVPTSVPGVDVWPNLTVWVSAILWGP